MLSCNFIIIILSLCYHFIYLSIYVYIQTHIYTYIQVFNHILFVFSLSVHPVLTLNPFPLLHWIFTKLSRKPTAAQLIIPLFSAALLFSSSSSPNRCLIMLRHPLLCCASPPGPFGGPSVCCHLSPPASPVILTGVVKSN